MIKLFGAGKPDHPMGDLREAKRILEELPAQDPFKALDELMHWLESVSAAEGFRVEQRIQVLFAVDDAAQSRLRRLGREYLAAARPSRFQENRLWSAVHGYWRQAGRSLARAVDLFVQNARGAESAKALLALLLVRALRSLAQQIKWMHLRYGPVDASVWGVLNSVYAYAEARKLAQAKVAVYPSVPGESSPQLELLKAAMFSAASPDSLLPQEAEFVERMIAGYAGRFALASAPSPELPFWTDLAQAMAPVRLIRTPQPGPGLRYLGAGAALGELSALIERIHTTRAVPAELGLPEGQDAEFALELLRHLAQVWSPQPPERKSQRHAVKTRLSVTHGYEGVLGVLGGGDSLDFDRQATESWIVENVSAGGFGAVVPKLKGDWLRVGALLAIQPEGGNNWVLGLVRRVNRTGGAEARVGIETLSRAPAASMFRVSGSRDATEQGVLIRNGEGAEARIVLKPGVYAPAQNLELAAGERQHVFIPQGIAERGEDFEIARFREMIRES